MHFPELNKIAATIEGWLTYNESRFLFDAASKLKNKGVIVEIGSYKGKSTAFIGNGAKISGIKKVYCVDPHIGSEKLREKLGVYNSFQEFQRNCALSEIDQLVIPIIDISENAIKTFNEDIEMLFIDGDHEYPAVKLDFDLWCPRLLIGGIICFHDTNLAGPKKVVLDLVLKSKNFKNAGRADSIIYAEKVDKNTYFDRMKNRLVYLSLRKFLCIRSVKSAIPASIKKLIKGKSSIE